MSTGSDKKLVVVWNDSRQTRQNTLPTFRLLSILTSQDFSWLQNGQLNCVSRGSMAFLFAGGFLLLFLRPIALGDCWLGDWANRQQLTKNNISLREIGITLYHRQNIYFFLIQKLLCEIRNNFIVVTSQFFGFFLLHRQINY